MTTDSDIGSNISLQPPKYLFLFISVYAAFLPFLGRLFYVPTNGWDWFTTYTQGGIAGLLLLVAFQVIPIAAWYLSAHYPKENYLPFWTSLISGTTYILHSHGIVDYSSSSTASLALVFIPVYAVGAIGIGWVLGYLLALVVKNNWQLWLLITLGVMGLIYGSPLYELNFIFTAIGYFWDLIFYPLSG